MKRLICWRALCLVLPASVLLGACGTPRDNLYTLNPVIEDSAPEPVPSYTVEVTAVTIPDLVDRPQIVLRDSKNRVSMLEQQRWAASLSSQLPQLIAENLGRLLPEARVKATGEAAALDPAYRVAVDISRFDSILNKAALLEAQWSARRLSDGALLAGQFSVSEPAGAGYEELAAAHARALGALSRQIAAAIRTDHDHSAAPKPAAAAVDTKKKR